jgi:tetratricopeptide (TPR) repeat protein
MGKTWIHRAAWAVAALLPVVAVAADSGSNEPDPAREIIRELLAEYRATQLALQASGATPAAQQSKPVTEPTAPPNRPADKSEKPTKSPKVETAAPARKKSTPADAKPAKPAAKQPAGDRAERPAPNVSALPDPTEIIRSLLETEKTRKMRDRRDGKKLFEDAQAASKGGRNLEAIRLARRAQKLDPENKEIVDFIAAVEKQTPTAKPVNRSHSRAAAHVAAALVRGRELMKAARYQAAVDLLLGVVQACLLFPESVSVDEYRRNAEEELALYRAAVDAKKIDPSVKPADADSRSRLVATENAPPLNLRRIYVGPEYQIPAWYSRQKNMLNTNMTVEYRGEPIALVLEDITQETGVPIITDVPVALARAHLNVLLNFRIAEVPAELVLNIACMKSGLEYVIMERAVVVTTPNKATEYLRQLPQALRNNWVAARVVFPELNPELLAAVRTTSRPTESDLDRDVPSYLLSGKALVQDVKQLLQ